MSDIETTLAERGKTHGEYSDHADITQRIKDVIRSGRTYDQTTPHERETLDMIAHKIGRIVSGNPHFDDHWRDIAGYATLSLQRVPSPVASRTAAEAMTMKREAAGDYVMGDGTRVSIKGLGPASDQGMAPPAAPTVTARDRAEMDPGMTLKMPITEPTRTAAEALEKLRRKPNLGPTSDQGMAPPAAPMMPRDRGAADVA